MTYYNIEENVFQKFLDLAFIQLNVVRNVKNQEQCTREV